MHPLGRVASYGGAVANLLAHELRSITMPAYEACRTRDGGRDPRMSDLDLNAQPKRRDGVRVRRVGTRVVLILDSQGLELNDTAEAVWRLCSGDASIQEIVDSIADEYDADPEQVAQDVVELIQELEALNALAIEPKS